jgi:hypothetical protein
MPAVSVDLVGTVVAALLTIMVLSYLVGDNPLFRTAVHIFVGVLGGYAGALAVRSVLVPRLVTPLLTGGASAITPLLILSWLLVILLVLKVSPATAPWGSLPVALMVGVGAGLVVGGAIMGTLLPQSLAAMETLDPRTVAPVTGETGVEGLVRALIMLVGTISTLFYFRFTVRQDASGEGTRSRLETWVAYAGRVFIAVTFGVIYAGVLSASIAVLAQRIRFLIDTVSRLVGG